MTPTTSKEQLKYNSGFGKLRRRFCRIRCLVVQARRADCKRIVRRSEQFASWSERIIRCSQQFVSWSVRVLRSADFVYYID